MDNRLINIYETLMGHYGEPNWWPARTTYEVILGAILTQNTAWSNVEKAIANFGEVISPEIVVRLESKELAKIIRPAGFFNQKTVYLKEATAWFERYRYDVKAVQRRPFGEIRKELLHVKGIGPETADSILLYAFGFTTFVVDAYTMRLCERYPINAGKSYTRVKAYFEENLPESAKIYNNFHALIVMNGKEHCKKRRPLCEGCPLSGGCGGHLSSHRISVPLKTI